MAAGLLGCGQYEVHITGRGGAPLLAVFPWNAVTWSRVLDDTSQAMVTGAGGDCCGLLADVRPWRHEIAIYRDGDLVWVGPVFNPSSSPSAGPPPSVGVAVSARDLSAWWDHRLIHTDQVYAGVDLATIFAAVANDAMAPDNSPGFTVASSPCGVTGSRAVLASQFVLAAQELRSISGIGVDWTVVARNALVGGTVVPAAPIATLIDEHFMLPPTPNLDGSAQANREVLIGNGVSVYGDATNAAAAAADGLLESVTTDTSILDSTQAQAGADSRVALTAAIIGIEGAVLTPDAPVTIDDLVPGAICQLELQDTCPPVSGPFRLKKIDVASQTAGATETVSLSFQPVGST